MTAPITKTPITKADAQRLSVGYDADPRKSLSLSAEAYVSDDCYQHDMSCW